MASGARPGSLVPPRSNSTSGIFPGQRTPDDPQVETCMHIDTHYDLIIASLCSVFIVCGILYTYFGEYCAKYLRNYRSMFVRLGLTPLGAFGY